LIRFIFNSRPTSKKKLTSKEKMFEPRKQRENWKGKIERIGIHIPTSVIIQ